MGIRSTSQRGYGAIQYSTANLIDTATQYNLLHYYYDNSPSSAQHEASQEPRWEEAKLQGTPLARSWETRKCDQGLRMCPITRGFPAIPT